MPADPGTTSGTMHHATHIAAKVLDDLAVASLAKHVITVSVAYATEGWRVPAINVLVTSHDGEPMDLLARIAEVLGLGDVLIATSRNLGTTWVHMRRTGEVEDVPIVAEIAVDVTNKPLLAVTR